MNLPPLPNLQLRPERLHHFSVLPSEKKMGSGRSRSRVSVIFSGPFNLFMTSVRPLVSVIVPCYRVTAFIAEALDSLRAQTFRDFEAIVVNDGCPDTENLERALAPYQSGIVY